MNNSIDILIQEMVREEVKKQVSAFVNDIRHSTTGTQMKAIYSNQDVLKMLNVDPKTLKKYRDNGELAFTQKDGKYFYSAEDI